MDAIRFLPDAIGITQNVMSILRVVARTPDFKGKNEKENKILGAIEIECGSSGKI